MSKWSEYAARHPEAASAHGSRPRRRSRDAKDRQNAAARARYAADIVSRRERANARNARPEVKAIKAERHVRRTYGVELAALVEAQSGVCALCGEPLREGKFRHVDHDHATGVVRGVLCSNCNTGLGKFRDNPDALRRAAAYLEQFTQE